MGIVIYNISIVRIVTLYVYIYILYYYIWLVVDLPLCKMMEFVSWDDEIPNMWKKTCSEPTTSIGVFKVFMVI